MHLLKKIIPAIFCLLFIAITNLAFGQKDSAFNALIALYSKMDSLEKSIKYQTGSVSIKDIATLNIPKGYKFIPSDKAMVIIHDIWGNPNDYTVLGMIVKDTFRVTSTDEWAFIIRYEESGYVKDEDADKINYDELLQSIKKSEEESNKERVKQGYPEIHILSWAAKPYYDKQNKILHWAKELQFGIDSSKQITLNYDVRILGRKGILSLNAVGSMDQLKDINDHIPEVIKIAKFVDGNKYTDFDPSVDKVAAYTIGGLIAGTLLTKTGFFIILLKYIKIILFAVFGGFAAFRKKISGWFSRKKKNEEDTVYTHVPPAIEDTAATSTLDTNHSSEDNAPKV